VNDEREFIRMTLSERVQHLLIMLSFVMLAVSGFALHFPNTRVGQITVAALGGPAGRALTHRIAAGVMIGTVLYHFGTLIYSAVANWQQLRERGIFSVPMVFNKQDLADIRQNLAYYLRATDRPARYGKYSYVEKIEYWSLLWGVVIMSLSGLVLWFPFRALLFLPGWVINLSLVVHSYEASLAVLAIVVWHWYHVHLSPDHFPMSQVWITGRMSASEMKKHHPLEYERLTGEPAEDEEA